MLDYLPSVVACCAIYVARKNMGRTCWSPTLEKYTKYQVEQLMPCLTEVRTYQYKRFGYFTFWVSAPAQQGLRAVVQRGRCWGGAVFLTRYVNRA